MNIYKWKCVVSFGVVAGQCEIARAEPQMIEPSCTLSANSLKRCVFPEINLAAPIPDPFLSSQNSQSLRTDFDLSYQFDCKGHPLGIHFVSGTSSVPVKYSAPGEAFYVTLSEGYGALRLADLELSQKTTYRATIVGDCKIRILQINAYPSFSTLENWGERASLLASHIKDNLAGYLEAKSAEHLHKLTLEEMARFQTNVVELMIDPVLAGIGGPTLKTFVGDVLQNGVLPDVALQPEWFQRAKWENPMLSDAVALWQGVDDVRRGLQPELNPHQKNALGQLQSSLVGGARARLEKSVEQGATMAAVLNQWRDKLKDEQESVLRLVRQEILTSCEKAKEAGGEACSKVTL